MKKYKAIFFDWDGTAVLTRGADATEVCKLMQELLKKEIVLIIISGTSYENIAPQIVKLIPFHYLKNLYLGLGRGAFNYGFSKEGKPIVLSKIIPTNWEKITLNKAVFDIHLFLLKKYNYQTDIVFNRPNYCKIDLLPSLERGDKKYIHSDEVAILTRTLRSHRIKGGLKHLLEIAHRYGRKYKFHFSATTDAKYLEIGMSTKGQNVDFLLRKIIFRKKIKIQECCFWGDEFAYIVKNIKGSDAYNITPLSKKADFFDVSEFQNKRLPQNVKNIGGGVKNFIQFLQQQISLLE